MADLGRKPFRRRGDDGERRKVHGVTVARDDLGRDRLRRQPHLLGHVGFNAWIDAGVGSNRARNRAGGHLLTRGNHALSGARKLGVCIGELEAERRGLGMDPMAAAYGGCHLVLERTLLECGEELVEVSDEKVGGARELDAEAGIEHV